ncbi:MAG: glutathione transferase GstA [Methylomicrobium sp.]
MKLYYSPGACSLAAHILVCETDLAVDLIKVDLASKTTDTGDDFRKINPNGYVPALLLDDGQCLTEIPAVMQYLGDLAGKSDWIPSADLFERYRLQQWFGFIGTELHKNFSPLFNPSAHEAVKQYASQMLTIRLDTVAEQLSSRLYLLGNDFSAADAYLFVVLSWARYVDFDLSRWPVFTRYCDRIAERPSVRQAMHEEGLI